MKKENIQVRRILLVDDDPIFGRMMREAAEELGIALIYFSSAKEAYRQLPKLRFDVAILDYQLGLVTGIQMANFMEKQTNRTPVLLVSAYEGIDAMVRERDPDIWPELIQRCLDKTVSPQEILSSAVELTSDEAR